ncbi:hypothetical protein S245_047604, partial [Arachis hypogaea]
HGIERHQEKIRNVSNLVQNKHVFIHEAKVRKGTQSLVFSYEKRVESLIKPLKSIQDKPSKWGLS